MRRFVNINGRTLTVTWELDAGQVRYQIDEDDRSGKPGTADVREVEPGIYLVLCGPNSHEVRLESIGNGSWRVHTSQGEVEIEIQDPRRPTRRRQGAGPQGRATISARMPGRIVRVLVKPGQAVQQGESLMVLEAMKMQNPVTSPKGGVVAAVLVKEGETVAAGHDLIAVD